MTHVFAAVASAALLGIASRPWGSGLLAWVALVPLLVVLANRPNAKRAAVAAWIASLGPGLAAFEGIAAVEPLGYLFVVALAGVPWAVAGFVVGYVGYRHGAGTALASAPFVWTGIEYLVAQRSWLGDYANALMQLGYTQFATPWMTVAGWSGVTGVTFVLLAANAAVAYAFSYAVSRTAARPTMLGTAGLTAVAVLVVASPFAPVPGAERPAPDADPLRVGVIQGAVSSTESLLARFDREAARTMVRPYASLTETAVERGADLVVWGETVVPMPVRPGHVPDYVRDALDPAPVALVGGVAYVDGATSNTIFHAEDGVLTEVYRKRALVPWIERNYRRGIRVPPLDVKGIPVGLGVCLDAVFGSLARESVVDGAGVLVYLTEDAFASTTVTPELHLRVAAFRAVETGRPVVFVNQSGPSAVFGTDGRARERLPFGRPAGAVVEVRPHVGITPYVRFGDLVGLIAVALVAVLLASSVFPARGSG